MTESRGAVARAGAQWRDCGVENFATGGWLPPRRVANEVEQTTTMLGMLKVLRHGGTAVLGGAREVAA